MKQYEIWWAHLEKRISRIPAKRIVEVKRAVGYALGWEELIQAGQQVV